jgi:preprotein translocase subunit SecA
VRGLVAEYASAEYHGDWNRDGLRARMAAMIPTLEPDALSIVDELTDPLALANELAELAMDAYDRKREETGEEGVKVLERLVLLRVIDSLWVEHLTAVDDMRRGIGLRAYSQRDPLNEFKVEAYRMFDELKSTIRHDVTNTVFKVTVVREAATPRPAQMIEARPDVVGGGSAASSAGAAVATSAAVAGGNGQQAPTRTGPKLGRNDPCWCGSGKKYKRCHGA